MTHGDPERAADTTSVYESGLIPSDTAPGADTSADTAESALAGAEGLPDGTALLVVKRGPNAGSRYQLIADVVTAGRHPDSDIFLDDVSVSRRHAEFRRSETGYSVIDVGSLNGTYVNREPIESSALAGGDEVQIGKFRLVYLTGPVAPAGDAGAPSVGDAPVRS